MDAIKFFDAVQYLEPECPKCKTKVEYGISTKYNEKKNGHVCLNCGETVE